MLSYPRCQQYRRLRRALATGAATAVALMAAAALGRAGEGLLASVALVSALGLGLSSRRWARLAGRSRVGARSEDVVRGRLAPLEAEGWRIRRSLRWRGGGDIDHVAIAPVGVVFAIETKTMSYSDDHLSRVTHMAAWLERRRRCWCPRGAVPILCVVRATRLERMERGVLIVSADRLVRILRRLAGTTHCPEFLIGDFRLAPERVRRGAQMSPIDQRGGSDRSSIP